MHSFKRILFPRSFSFARAAVAAGLALGVAAPALADGLWRFRAANGVWAYVDDEKKIPEAYKAAAEQLGDLNLADYAKYTPADGEATKAYSEALAKRIEVLRAINEEGARGRRVRVFTPSGDLVGPGADTVVRTSSRFGTTIETQVGAGYGDAPLVTEQVRLRVPDRMVTRTNTITRRGDQVIAIQRPLPAQNPLPDLYDVESDDAVYPFYDRVSDW